MYFLAWWSAGRWTVTGWKSFIIGNDCIPRWSIKVQYSLNNTILELPSPLTPRKRVKTICRLCHHSRRREGRISGKHLQSPTRGSTNMRHPACNKRGCRSEGVFYLLQVDGIASKSQYRRSNEQLQPIPKRFAWLVHFSSCDGWW
jgi:hypothetical protein